MQMQDIDYIQYGSNNLEGLLSVYRFVPLKVYLDHTAHYLKSTLTQEDELREEKDLGPIPVPLFHHDHGPRSTIPSLLKKLFPAFQELSIFGCLISHI